MAFHTFIFHRKESMEISLYFISFTENIDFLTIFYFIVLYLSYIFNTGTWSEACIVELLILLLSVLITFCLFFEFARNSSFFYLKRICSINNTLFLTAVPDRLKCVISLVDYLMLCKILISMCVDIYFIFYFSHFLLRYIVVLHFRQFFDYKIVFKFALI